MATRSRGSRTGAGGGRGSLATVLLGMAIVLGPGTARAQENPKPEPPPAPPAQLREWKEGSTIRLRVPVATETQELMSTVAFPETGIRSAVTGWGPATLTAIQKGNLLFLRLSRKSEGQIGVLGESGATYLLYVEGVDAKSPGGHDAFVKIVRAGAQGAESAPAVQAPRAPRPRPKGALDLIRAMRLGERPPGSRTLRAGGDVVFVSDDLELRLLFVTDAPPYLGRIYEVRNRSSRKLALDASRFRAKGEDLILSGLRENVIPPGGVSRLYTVFWRP